MLVGKQHCPHPERPAGPPVKVELDCPQQAFQHRSPQAGAVQEFQTGIGGGSVHQGGADFPGSAAERRMGTEQLGAAVGSVGMGVHNTARHLDQLAHMAHQKHLFKAGRCSHIQRITDKV